MRKTTSLKAYSSNSAGLTISPAAVFNTAVIKVSGDPRTNPVNLDPTALENGDAVDLLIIYTDPSVAGIILEIRCTTPESVLLASVASDGVQPNALLRFTADGLGGFQLIERTIPAFLS